MSAVRGLRRSVMRGSRTGAAKDEGWATSRCGGSAVRGELRGGRVRSRGARAGATRRRSGPGSAVAGPVPPLSYPPPSATRKPNTGVAVPRVVPRAAAPSAPAAFESIRRSSRAHLTLGALLVIACAAPAGAQIIKVPRAAEPAVWTSLGIALFQTQGVDDGRTRSAWDMARSSAAQYRGSLEWAIRNQASIGLVGTFARVPFRYLHRSDEEPPPVPCPRCDAHLDISSLGLQFHVGGGLGLHQVIQAQAGITRYSNLRADNGLRLAPRSDQDLSFAVGYGFGYSVSPRFQISIVQDFGFVLHQREGLSGNEGSTIQQRTTRLNVRYGLFRQKPKV